MKNRKSYNVKLTLLEEEICRFDRVLDRIQLLMPDDMRVYDHVVQVRDAVFRLQQSLHKCEIIEFACGGLDDVIDASSWSLADLFWDRTGDGEEEEEDKTTS